MCVHVLVSLESISTCFAPLPQLMDPVSWFDFNLNTLTTQQGHFDGHRHGSQSMTTRLALRKRPNQRNERSVWLLEPLVIHAQLWS